MNVKMCPDPLPAVQLVELHQPWKLTSNTRASSPVYTPHGMRVVCRLVKDLDAAAAEEEEEEEEAEGGEAQVMVAETTVDRQIFETILAAGQ